MALGIPSTIQLQAMFAPVFDLIDAVGEQVVVRENTGPSQYTDHPPVKAKPMALRTEDLMAGSPAQQGDFYLIIKADVFPVARALENKDRVRFRGRDYAIVSDDSNQYSIGGRTMARKLHVRG